MPKAKKTAPAGVKKSVPERAVLRRVNRKLAEQDEVVQRSRAVQTEHGPIYDNNTGRFYIVNTARNIIAHAHVDLEALAKELGVLKPWEQVA